MLAPRHLIALGLVALLVGEGVYFEFDYASLLGGDPLLLAILLAAGVLVVLNYVRPRRGILLASGIGVSLVPAIVLFVFASVLALAQPGNAQEFLGALFFLVSIALALPPAILGFRRWGR